MRAILFHNPSAGSGDTTREALIGLLTQAGITPLYQSTKVGQMAAALAQPADLIVVAGGDGSVSKVLAQMPDRRIPVAILPLGTANNIASSFGIGGRLEDIALGLKAAARRTLDVGKATGPWGVSWIVEGAGVGAMVRAAHDVGVKGRSGAQRLRAARQALRRRLKDAQPDRVQILADDERLPEESLMVEVLNIACGGPRLFLGPNVDPGDGLLDVLLLEPGQREEMRRWLEEEHPAKKPPMVHRRCRHVRIMWDGVPLRVDDDFPPPVRHGVAAVELELLADPATILVPPTDGQPGVTE